MQRARWEHQVRNHPCYRVLILRTPALSITAPTFRLQTVDLRGRDTGEDFTVGEAQHPQSRRFAQLERQWDRRIMPDGSWKGG